MRDTSRVNAPQSLNLLEEQDTLTVFGFDAKLRRSWPGWAAAICRVLWRNLTLTAANWWRNALNLSAAATVAGWRESASGLAASGGASVQRYADDGEAAAQ